MHTQKNWFSLQCARMAVGLLSKLKENELEGFSSSLARVSLRYYLTPIDLIPSFIPIVGYLDDYILMLGAKILCDSEEGELTYTDIPGVEMEIRSFLFPQENQSSE